MKLRTIITCVSMTIAVCALTAAPAVSAIGSQQNPQSGATGLEGTVPGNPPTSAATIATPSNGQVFTSIPITVSGLCQSGLLIKIFSNNVFVGSVTCTNGSYSLQVDLFSGVNNLVAEDFDNLDQQGPDSNSVSVTFNDAQYAQFGTRVTLTSNYARMGADPGSPMTWPLILSGGVGPYAISVDWGDGSNDTLQSASFPGVIDVTHTYQQAGVYTITAKATDANNTAAYLQLVGVADGKISGSLSTNNNGKNGTTKTIIAWQPMIIAIPLMIIVFWLGQRYELYTIRKSIEASREQA